MRGTNNKYVAAVPQQNINAAYHNHYTGRLVPSIRIFLVLAIMAAAGKQRSARRTVKIRNHQRSCDTTNQVVIQPATGEKA